MPKIDVLEDEIVQSLDQLSPQARRQALKRLLPTAAYLERAIDRNRPRIEALARQRGLEWNSRPKTRKSNWSMSFCMNRAVDASSLGYQRLDLRAALRGAPHECLLSAEAEFYDLVLAESILEELRNTLIEKFQNTADEVQEILAGLRRRAILVTLSGRCGWVVADPDDDKFIESALVGHADVIVSGDHHLLNLGTVEGIPILSPRQFLQKLAKETD